MLKKTLTIFMAIMLLISGISSYAMVPYGPTGEVIATEVPYGLLEELGILHLSEYKTMDATVTKGMFLKWAIRMTGMIDENIPTASKRVFLDIPLENEYASWAEFGYDRGIVRGNDIGSLEAESVVLANDAAVMAVRAAGYDVDEALMLRTKTAVLDGVNPNVTLTAESAMQILWNTLSLPAMMIGKDGRYTDSNLSILNQLFKVYTHRGIIDDDAVININSGVSKLTPNQISIEGVIYQVKADAWAGLAGYHVHAYVREEAGVKKAIFINPIDNKVRSLKADTVNSYTNGVMELDDKKTLRVSDTAKHIWNFERVYLTNGELTLPKDGTIITIDNNSDNSIDCVIVYEPKYGIVVEKDEKDNELYINQGTSKVYQLNEYDKYEIYNYDGVKISLTEVQTDALAEIYTSKDQSRVVFFVQKNVQEHAVSTLKRVDGKDVAIASDGTQLVISPHFKSLNATSVQAGKAYQMTLDSDGRIASVKEIVGGDLTYGYLFSYSAEGVFESDVIVAIYTVNGQMITAKTKDKLRVKQDDEDEMISAKELLKKLEKDFKPTLIRYALDGSGKISQIEYPSADKFSNGFRCVGTSGSATSGALLYDSRMRASTIGMIGGQILLDQKATKVLLVPSELNVNADWKILSVADALKDSKYYQSLKGYGVNPDSMTADVVVMPESKMDYADGYNLLPGLISGFEETYDIKKNERYTVLRMFQDGGEVALRLAEDVKPQYTLSTTGEVIDLAVGDVVRVVTDYNGCVISIKLLFDENTHTCYGVNDSTTDHIDRGYGYSQRTNYGTPYKIVGNAMYLIKEGEITPSSDIFRTDIGTIYEYDSSKENPIRVIGANDIETLSTNASATNKVFIQLSYSKSLITVLYK